MLQHFYAICFKILSHNSNRYVILVLVYVDYFFVSFVSQFLVGCMCPGHLQSHVMRLQLIWILCFSRPPLIPCGMDNECHLVVSGGVKIQISHSASIYTSRWKGTMLLLPTSLHLSMVGVENWQEDSENYVSHSASSGPIPVGRDTFLLPG